MSSAVSGGQRHLRGWCRGGRSCSTSTATRSSTSGLRHRGHLGRPLRPASGGRGHRAGGVLRAHLLHGEPLRELHRAVREARRGYPRRLREALGAAQLRCRGRRERREDRPGLHRPAGRGGLRPRLPRAHQPDHGHDRKGLAVQGRLRPVRAGDLPGRDGPTPTAGRPVRRTAPRRPSPTSSSRCTSRSARSTWRAVVLEPIQGEGGFIVPAPGLPGQAGRVVPRQRSGLHRR